MGKIILVTGGARSGKSNYAENIAKDIEGKILYIATSIPFDDEMKHRVEKHKESRPEVWDTYEGYKDLDIVVREKNSLYDGMLLDCVTIMTSNFMFDYIGDKIGEADNITLDKVEKKIITNFEKLLNEVNKGNSTMILVTNELGYGIVPENKLARVYRDIIGRINQYIASRASEVYLVVCGIPMKVK
ncbi:bifunctional adenosylcobinamide kinase/adenosylcobinamide-phosphate guanylyltransferase [Clostridium botulinum C]|uniref:Adenosylcobinamide kinase n=3 Tax=Clostridium botulinum TaxID=1491 RepID=A0A9Q4TK11_CLOBO|nr:MULTISPECIES: bifunctional adenosylcobinamide kinase/adenosylcobinamide-phosphate guanylyltransferase [Clostridium]AYF54855.1 bifunctional adenosylcobinamide kinase/adenosylcobinamide-phosphate guanylyltransferase [Clostridium novyi]EES91770.1 bifunctional adenosylcobalamin biosynthesis protein CobP [Clostridium botulinum D str. 1873]KEI10460.1 cobinamide kinase [Clostridium sp. K25]MBO3441917.1 bifunctional adenosylcobinamide kinase/adenosylcobinamide-phosphate guanylyltransferase [Clostrid